MPEELRDRPAGCGGSDRGYPSAVPYVLYRDPASAWIAEVTGFREVLRFTMPEGGLVGHVELERDGDAVLVDLERLYHGA